jgi:hypothetical protein
VHFGLDTIASDEKEGMRNLILGGGPWSSLEQTAILDYCEGDVDALARLLPVMLPDIDLPRALLRGRCMADNAWIEGIGIPIDVETLTALQKHWKAIMAGLIANIDQDLESSKSARSRRPASPNISNLIIFPGSGSRPARLTSRKRPSRKPNIGMSRCPSSVGLSIRHSLFPRGSVGQRQSFQRPQWKSRYVKVSCSLAFAVGSLRIPAVWKGIQ